MRRTLQLKQLITNAINENALRTKANHSQIIPNRVFHDLHTPRAKTRARDGSFRNTTFYASSTGSKTTKKFERKMFTSGHNANANKMNERDDQKEKKNRDMLYYLLAITAGTVGMSYASVPLYRAFCRATGFGGTTQRRTIEDKIEQRSKLDRAVIDKAEKRKVEITFNADVAEGLPWSFVPTQKKVFVKPGETCLAFYTCENKHSQPITGVATYNVQPGKAGQYFNKIQCFCFEEQRLRANEKVDMPVFFYLDPEFASDPAMNDVSSLVLSYTFFQSDDFEGDEYDEENNSNTSSSSSSSSSSNSGGVKIHGTGIGPDGKPVALPS
jgi:cytochrome c oxidase assembly protein subunit 11